MVKRNKAGSEGAFQTDVEPVERTETSYTQVMPAQPSAKKTPAGAFVPATSTTKHAKKEPAATTPGNSYSQYSRGRADYSDRKKGVGGGRKGPIIAAVIVILLLIAGIAFAAFQIYKTQINDSLHSMDQESLEAVDAALTGTTSFDEPFTILLVGSDERENNPDMGARSDTIILMRVDVQNKSVSMLSIPRDTMVEIEGVGSEKINAAYSYYGAAGTIDAVEKLTGVEISHYASINFNGLVALVDALGGIDVYVDETIENYDLYNGVIEAGEQHLDGEQALLMARCREFYDGDYTRQVNQRKVVEGIANKLMAVNVADLPGLVQTAFNYVQTDSGITFDWLFSLAQAMRDAEGSVTFSTASLPSHPETIDGISYVIADTAEMNALIKTFNSGGDISGGSGTETAKSDSNAEAEQEFSEETAEF